MAISLPWGAYGPKSLVWKKSEWKKFTLFPHSHDNHTGFIIVCLKNANNNSNYIYKILLDRKIIYSDSDIRPKIFVLGLIPPKLIAAQISLLFFSLNVSRFHYSVYLLDGIFC